MPDARRAIHHWLWRDVHTSHVNVLASIGLSAVAFGLLGWAASLLANGGCR